MKFVALYDMYIILWISFNDKLLGVRNHCFAIILYYINHQRFKER